MALDKELEGLTAEDYDNMVTWYDKNGKPLPKRSSLKLLQRFADGEELTDEEDAQLLADPLVASVWQEEEET